MPQYSKLKELLEKESFPQLFHFKFIGKNSQLFLEGVQALELQYPKLVLQTKRMSGNQNHVSFTYLLEATSPEIILEIFRSISQIPDVLIIL